jgi:hypothetical protein
MGVYTYAEAKAQLDLWIAASAAVANNQSYTMGNRSLTRADLGEIREMIVHWETRVAAAQRPARRGVRYAG